MLADLNTGSFPRAVRFIDRKDVIGSNRYLAGNGRAEFFAYPRNSPDLTYEKIKM